MKAEQSSWKMFRGNAMRTGISSSTLSAKPSLKWVTELGPMISSPIIDNGIVYVATTTGRIFALNMYQREEKWHTNIDSPIISSPLIEQDLLICATFDSWIKEKILPSSNHIVALYVNTGEIAWKIKTSGDVFSSPCLANDIIVVGSLDKYIYAVDMQGDLKWRVETQGEVWSSPSFNGNELFVGSDDGFIYCLTLDGGLQWKTKLDGKIRSSSPCLSNDGLIFIGTHNGSIYCLKQSNGLIMWD